MLQNLIYNGFKTITDNSWGDFVQIAKEYVAVRKDPD